MITIKDLIELVKNQNIVPGDTYVSSVSDADISIFMDMFDIPYCNWNSEFSNRVKQHWVKSWICTDTRVGISLYSFDGEFIAISCQRARKSDEEIFFFNKEHGIALKKYCLEIYESTYDSDFPVISIDADASDIITNTLIYHVKDDAWEFDLMKQLT